MNDFNEQQKQRLRIKSNLEKFAWWQSKITNEKLSTILDHRVAEYLLENEKIPYSQYVDSIEFYERRKNEKSTKY